jgi:telomere length regulation protein
MLSQLVPVLQHKSQDDPLWRRVCHSLFCRVSSLAMEPLLVEMVQLLPPSLANPHPLYLLLGDLATTNQKARHVFSHKLWLARLPSNENAAYNLIGYLMSWEAGQDLLGQSLRSAMGVWSEGGAVRRMDGRQHMWLCRLLVLGTTCLASHLTPPTSTVLKEGVMRGLQSHLDTAVPGVRERGMATGQCLMNTLHSRPTEQLHFDLGENPEVESILQLAEPVAEQQERLCGNLPPTPPLPPLSPLHEGREESCASGLVRVTEAGDSDSDDDLEPYDMSHDPDNSKTPPPRYLLDCLSVLVSPTERGPVEAALSSLPSLVSREPSDLSEVCVDLGRALIHLQDNWDLPSFPALRHSALVSLTTARPRLLAPFLVTEFYSPNHNLRQRLDILEVISSGATQLSSPSTDVTPSPSPPPPTPGKPWQQEVEERLKAKTRIISKGPRVPPPTATPSRFSAVAPLFFYPLIAPYDRALPSLDLLGRDSLLLGHLVRVLGNVVWCACHAPCQPAMARSLLEFLWAVRYHNSSFVRQAVLCALNMAVVATPTNYLLTDMHEALAETMLWVQDVSSSDGDDDVRALAARSLSILAQVTGENT